MAMSIVNRKYIQKQVRFWLDNINKKEVLPPDIVLLHFRIYEDVNEPYRLSLSGSKDYNPQHTTWLGQEDYVPRMKNCTDIKIPYQVAKDEAIRVITKVLSETVARRKKFPLLQVKHITTGMDTKIIVIK